MADPKNPGQFGNRPDTEERAREGGESSGGNTQNLKNQGDSTNRASNLSEEDRERGGKHSHDNQYTS